MDRISEREFFGLALDLRNTPTDERVRRLEKIASDITGRPGGGLA